MDSAHTPILDTAAVTHRGLVYPWQCDHMGHMNVMWYVGKFDEAVWNLFARVGLTPGCPRGSGRGMVAVNSVVTGVLGKVVHVHQTLFNAELGHVVASMDVVAVHLDTAARRATAFAPLIAERLQAELQP